MMQQHITTPSPHFWLREHPPYYSNVWLFKTHHIRGNGVYEARQQNPSGITLRIITHGTWQLYMAGKKAVARIGDVFLALPGEYIEFCHLDANMDWAWYELQFNGPAALAFVGEFGLSRNNFVITPRQRRSAIRLFRQLYLYTGQKDRNPTTAMALLFRLIAACGKPEQPTESGRQNRAACLVKKAITLVEIETAAHPNVKELAQRLEVDRTTLSRAFLSETGKTPHQFLDSYSLIKAQELLQSTGDTINSVADACGFNDAKYFIGWFRRLAGIPPGQWRQKSREEPNR